MTKIKVLQTEEKLWIKESVNNTKNTVFIFDLKYIFVHFEFMFQVFVSFSKHKRRNWLNF